MWRVSFSDNHGIEYETDITVIPRNGDVVRINHIDYTVNAVGFNCDTKDICIILGKLKW